MTSSHPPTPEQQAILMAVKESKTSLMITAFAGTGKTTTLTMIANAVPMQPALALAFNVNIKKELEKRFPSFFKVMTLNGLGHLAWMRATRGKTIVLEERKLGKIITQVFKDHQYQGNEDAWSNIRSLVSAAMQAGIVPAARPHKGLRPDTGEQWAILADSLWLQDIGELEIGMARLVLERSVDQAFEGIISFDDQIYMPTMFNGQFPRFGLTLVDEAQDLNILQHIMVNRSSGGRLIICGDPKQCHPPGTMIKIVGGKEKPIEELKPGDELVSLEMGRAWFRGMSRSKGVKILDKRQFKFEGNLIRISASKFTHLCTPEHRCLVKFNNNEGHAIYLMQKGENFRIGMAKMHYHTGFGPVKRARSEGADKLWILSCTESREQAIIEEKVIAAQFGLPDIQFDSTAEDSFPQYMLDAIWSRVGNNAPQAWKCLQYFGRKIEFPFWPNTDAPVGLGERPFFTQACNVMDFFMDIRVFDGDIRGINWLAVSVDLQPYKGDVFGIEVEPNEMGHPLYLANDIVTHNSIYAFRGADSQSMGKLRKLRPEWIDLPLATTFRCPKVIVDRQQRHAPGFVAFHTNAIGEVKRHQRYLPVVGTDTPEGDPQTWTWQWIESLNQQRSIAILSRNNAPLLKIAFKLLRANVPVTMLGRDIGKTLVALSRKVLPDDDMKAADCVLEVNAWRDSQVALANANGQEEKVANLHDQAECLLAVIEGARAENATAIRWYLKELFDRQSGHVVISTIHRAKGLEFSTVLHLDPWRIPSKFAQQNPAQMQQEMNLLYVAETRCQRLLIEANLEDFE